MATRAFNNTYVQRNQTMTVTTSTPGMAGSQIQPGGGALAEIALRMLYPPAATDNATAKPTFAARVVNTVSSKVRQSIYQEQPEEGYDAPEHNERHVDEAPARCGHARHLAGTSPMTTHKMSTPYESLAAARCSMPTPPNSFDLRFCSRPPVGHREASYVANRGTPRTQRRRPRPSGLWC